MPENGKTIVMGVPEVTGIAETGTKTETIAIGIMITTIMTLTTHLATVVGP